MEFSQEADCEGFIDLKGTLREKQATCIKSKGVKAEVAFGVFVTDMISWVFNSLLYFHLSSDTQAQIITE